MTVYLDGHNRVDVLAFRVVYCDNMVEYSQYMMRGLWDNAMKQQCPFVTTAGAQRSRHVAADSPRYGKCCAHRALELQQDFKDQRCWMEELIEGRGHKVIFLPKFHPELNFIERYWGKIKKWLRWHCDDSWFSLLRNVDFVMNSDKVCDLTLMRRYSRICWRYLDAYHKGMTAEEAVIAARKYKSHRMVLKSMDDHFDDGCAAALERVVVGEGEEGGGGGEAKEGEEKGREEEDQEDGDEEDEEFYDCLGRMLVDGEDEDGEIDELPEAHEEEEQLVVEA